MKTLSLKQMRFIAAAMTCFVGARCSRADTLVLDDGRRVSGEVTETERGYTLKTKAGQITFATSQVTRWEKESAASTAGPTAPASPAAPAGKPVPKADPADINARAAKLIDQGAVALETGDAQAALENFLDARSVWERQRIYLNPSADPFHLAVLEGIGAAYLALGRYEKANEPLERAFSSKVHGRSLILNRAILDYAQRTNVMHGVRELKDFITTESTSDEVALNILGASLGLAGQDEHFYQTQFYQEALAFYDARNAVLEASRPGAGRWGTEWISAAAARVKISAADRALLAYKNSIERVRTANDQLRVAQGQSDRASLPNPTISVDSANAALARAQANVATAMTVQKEAWKAIPRPEWPKTFAPLLPEFIAPGVFGQPREPNPIAVATPLPAPRPAPPAPVDVKPPPANTIAHPPLPPVATAPPITPTAPARPTKRMITRNAVAVPVAPDLLLTAAPSVENAVQFDLESSGGDNFRAELVRKDPASGLALLRVAGKQFRYLNLAPAFNGGEVVGWGYPEVSIFVPVVDSIPATATAPRTGWTVSLRRQPRLAGTAMVDKTNALVGITLGDRDSVMTRVPAATLEQIRTFLGSDAPKAANPAPDPSGVLQLTASHEVP